MATTAIILMNLGSPDSTKVDDVKTYLNEFLMDGRVIDKPYWLRLLLVKGLIVPKRAANSAAAYQKIWWKEGSPLIVLTEQLKESLAKHISYPIEIAMRYGHPHPQQAYSNLIKQNPDLEEVILVPLYPHYAMSSYETAVAYMQEVYEKGHYSFELKVVPPFYNHPAYIKALSASIRPYLQEPFDQLLFSYHGIPERHVLKTDPTKNHCMQEDDCCYKKSESHPYCYRHQVTITSELVAKSLGLKKEQWKQSYQSRLGRDPWLLPSTQERLPNLPKEGIKNLLVVCPSFVSECLETLEEIALEGKRSFIENGGSSFTYIPCMNLNTYWLQALIQLIEETKTTMAVA